jgi:hypothetical protein
VESPAVGSASFDEVRDLYNEERPGYPPTSIDAIIRFAGLSYGSRIVEVG